MRLMTDKKYSDRHCNLFVLYIVTVLSDSILGNHVFFLNSLPVLKGAMSAGEHARRGFANYFQLSKFYLVFDIFYFLFLLGSSGLPCQLTIPVYIPVMYFILAK